MAAGDQFLEVRSTVPDVLDAYPFLTEDPPSDAETLDEAFSIVVDDSTKRKRRLPSLYVATYQVFADRDVVKVLNRFLRTTEAVRAAITTPVYAVHPCEIDGIRGLYGKDFFSRAPFRRRLARLGMRFSEDPYPRLTSDGGFEAHDWGKFEPRFIVMPNVDAADSEQPVEVRGAALLFNVLSLRLGRPDPQELYRLRPVIERLAGIGGGHAGRLLEAIHTRVA